MASPDPDSLTITPPDTARTDTERGLALVVALARFAVSAPLPGWGRERVRDLERYARRRAAARLAALRIPSPRPPVGDTRQGGI